MKALLSVVHEGCNTVTDGGFTLAAEAVLQLRHPRETGLYHSFCEHVTTGSGLNLNHLY